jgi:hypothetical protein
METMARLQTDVADGDHVDKQRLTLGDYLDQWMATAPLKGWSANGTEGYRNAVENYIKPRLGSVPLQALTRDRIKAFYGWCLRANSRASVVMTRDRRSRGRAWRTSTSHFALPCTTLCGPSHLC